MQLKKIEMKNFRQFFGYHSVEFATGSKNTTVILGNNNTGKTGLYRAVMFGLYGLRKLSQDSNQGDVHLVNFKALEESNLVETSVKITLEASDEEYIITRKMSGSNVQGAIRESRDNEVSLDFKDKSGEYHPNYKNKDTQIQDVINDILDENIKEFFLFDGEKIETLARADKASRSEVKEGIVKLMEIDKFDKVKDVVRSIYNSEKSNLTKKSANIELDIIQNDIEKTTFQIEKANITIVELEANIISIEEELLTIQEEMKNNKENIEILSQKKELSKELIHTKQMLASIKSKLSDFMFRNLSPLVLSDYTMSLNEKLKSRLLKQDDLIPKHVLSQTLESNVCLCCNQDIGNLERDYISILQKDYKYSQLTPILDNISRNLENFKQDKDRYMELIDKDLKEINKLRTTRIRLERDIELLDQRMLNVNQSEEVLKGLSARKEQLDEEKINDTSKLTKLKLALSDFNDTMSDLDLKYSKSLKENAELEYEIKRLEFIDGIDKKVNKRYNEYVSNTRKVLGDKTTETFKNLIDYKQQSLVRTIEINDKYQMIVKYNEGLDVTQDISQGQQMIVALSFITSLASIASKNDERLDYPLFMDSPFGRLSQTNRKNLIQNLPNLTNQWIPLLTDSDYTQYEQREFENMGRVGKVYQIKKITEDCSTIEDITDSKGGF